MVSWILFSGRRRNAFNSVPSHREHTNRHVQVQIHTRTSMWTHTDSFWILLCFFIWMLSSGNQLQGQAKRRESLCLFYESSPWRHFPSTSLSSVASLNTHTIVSLFVKFLNILNRSVTFVYGIFTDLERNVQFYRFKTILTLIKSP